MQKIDVVSTHLSFVGSFILKIREKSKSLNMKQNETKEIIKKLFDMMENFAKRLLEIENSS